MFEYTHNHSSVRLLIFIGHPLPPASIMNTEDTQSNVCGFDFVGLTKELDR